MQIQLECTYLNILSSILNNLCFITTCANHTHLLQSFFLLFTCSKQTKINNSTMNYDANTIGMHVPEHPFIHPQQSLLHHNMCKSHSSPSILLSSFHLLQTN